MNNNTFLIAGSTGFLGSKVLNYLSKENTKIYCLSRRKNLLKHRNIEELIINFESLEEFELPKIDHIILCLGYELRAWELLFMPEKLKKSFYKVDYDYTLSIAKKSLELGASSISLVSAVGANKNSSSFYLKTKGDLEDEIKKLPFNTINIFQPGHLAGRTDWQRKKNDFRIDVSAFDIASNFLDPFMLGVFKKYRSIKAVKLAEFLVEILKENKKGINYFQFDDFVMKM